jgi:hypothetical protein
MQIGALEEGSDDKRTEAAQRLTCGERLRGYAAPALRDTASSAPRWGASGAASLT